MGCGASSGPGASPVPPNEMAREEVEELRETDHARAPDALDRLWLVLDKDGSNSIDASEFVELLKVTGMADATTVEAEEFIAMVTANVKDGHLGKEGLREALGFMDAASVAVDKWCEQLEMKRGEVTQKA